MSGHVRVPECAGRCGELVYDYQDSEPLTPEELAHLLYQRQGRCRDCYVEYLLQACPVREDT